VIIVARCADTRGLSYRDVEELLAERGRSARVRAPGTSGLGARTAAASPEREPVLAGAGWGSVGAAACATSAATGVAATDEGGSGEPDSAHSNPR
jgi:hypothetical protein